MANPENQNPLEYGVVGKNGDTNVTNYAWVDIDIDGVKITNIPMSGDTWDYNGKTLYTSNDSEYHALHDSGFNCYIKSFRCKRAIPKSIKGFWNAAGGGMECSITVFDPTFIQFEQLVMEKIKHQKVHCKVSYGISQTGTNLSPAPFELHCLITKMNEAITAAGAEWSLELSTTPPEFFDTYPEIGKDNKKETTYSIGPKEQYKCISDLVKELLEKELWRGVVIKTKPLKKKRIIPTKDFNSRIDLVRDKLAPMAQCADNTKQDKYHLLIGLDGAVYFMPAGMTIKEALESELAEKINSFDIQKARQQIGDQEAKIKESIEQLNMKDYVSEDNGRLTFKYGFKNSIVQSFQIQYDCMSMITQYYYHFVFKNEKGDYEEFNFPDISEKQKKQIDKKVKNNIVFLWDTDMESAKETAKTIVRKLHVVDYQGTATLINWPYIMPMQQVTFQYLIPNGSKEALNASNTNKPLEPNDPELEAMQEKANQDESLSQRVPVPDKDSNEKKKTPIQPGFSQGTIDNKKVVYQNKDMLENEKKRKQAFSRRTALKGNSLYTLAGGDNANNQFKQNIGIPTTLGAWSDEHKSSVIYLVLSITDTVESGLMTSELELTALLADSFPQINEALKNN